MARQASHAVATLLRGGISPGPAFMSMMPSLGCGSKSNFRGPVDRLCGVISFGDSGPIDGLVTSQVQGLPLLRYRRNESDSIAWETLSLSVEGDGSAEFHLEWHIRTWSDIDLELELLHFRHSGC